MARSRKREKKCWENASQAHETRDGGWEECDEHRECYASACTETSGTRVRCSSTSERLVTPRFAEHGSRVLSFVEPLPPPDLMPPPVVFTRQLAQLLWLLVHRPTMTSEQKEALRLALVETRGEGRSLSLTALIQLIAEARQLLPAPTELPWLVELAERMAGHSVTTLEFSENARAADLLGIARLLANPPMPEDEGASFDARVVELGPLTVSVRLGRAGSIRRDTPTEAKRKSGARPAKTPPLGLRIVAPGIAGESSIANGIRTPTPSPRPAASVNAPLRRPPTSASAEGDARNVVPIRVRRSKRP